MYESIYKFAVNNNLSTKKYFTKRKIAGYIHIQKDGTFEYIEVIKKDDIQRKDCPVRLPGGNDAPCFIVDKLFKYVVEDEKNQKKHDRYVQSIIDASGTSQTIGAISAFLKRMDEEADRNSYLKQKLNSGLKDNDYVSWKVEGCKVEDDDSWISWFLDLMQSSEKNKTSKGFSILSGNTFKYGASTFPMISQGPVGSGVSIFSNQHSNYRGSNCAFKSYGFKNAYDACPIAESEAEAIKAGVEHLFTSGHNYNRSFGVLYWYDQEKQIDLMESFNANEVEDAWKDILESVVARRDIIDELGVKMHVIKYNIPAQGRFTLTNERVIDYDAACSNLIQWYKDSRLTDAFYDIKEKTVRIITRDLSNTFSVLRNTVKSPTNDAEKIKAEHGDDVEKFLFSVLLREQIPVRIYSKALRHAERAVVLDGFDSKEKRSRRIILQIIKTYLIRTGKEENYMREVLKKDSRNAGYLCGRVIAIMDRLQRAALVKVGVKISQKYIKLVINKTNIGMTMVLEHEEDYLKKLEGQGEQGSRIAGIYRSQLNDVLAGFEETFPSKLSTEEQGALYLGLHHQDLDMTLRAKEAADKKREAENLKEEEVN